MISSVATALWVTTTLCTSVAAFLPAVGRSGRHLSIPRQQHNSIAPTTAAAPLHLLPDEPMEDRFDRWRLLQNILDLNIEQGQVEALVATVVAGSASRPPGIAGSPIGTTTNEEENDWSQYRNDVLALERYFLPDPDDDKDAFDSLWDTVAEIHGRDAVRIDLRAEPRWPYVCGLARVLLQYDFLSRGISVASAAATTEEEEEQEEETAMDGTLSGNDDAQRKEDGITS
jgi:hypothetical protein